MTESGDSRRTPRLVDALLGGHHSATRYYKTAAGSHFSTRHLSTSRPSVI